MNFGHALEALKAGKRVARAGWNGRGMWLALSPGAVDLPAASYWSVQNRAFAESNGGSATTRPYITLKTADNEIVPWVASQSDLLVEDWLIV